MRLPQRQVLFMAPGRKGLDMNWKQILRTLPVVAFGNLVMAAGIVLFIRERGFGSNPML